MPSVGQYLSTIQNLPIDFVFVAVRRCEENASHYHEIAQETRSEFVPGLSQAAANTLKRKLDDCVQSEREHYEFANKYRALLKCDAAPGSCKPCDDTVEWLFMDIDRLRADARDDLPVAASA